MPISAVDITDMTMTEMVMGVASPIGQRRQMRPPNPIQTVGIQEKDMNKSGIARSARRKLYKKALVWDDHSGFDPHGGADLNNLEIWRKAGVHYLSVNVGYDVVDWQATIKTLARFRAWLQTHPKKYALVRTTADIKRAAQGRQARHRLRPRGHEFAERRRQHGQPLLRPRRAPDAVRLQSQQPRRRRLPRRQCRPHHRSGAR